MKLVGELKEKVGQTKSLEEAKMLIEEAGMELTDEEMDEVAGGQLSGSVNIRVQMSHFAFAKEQEG